MKIYLEPEFSGPDKGDGGVRRVVEAQRKHLPSYGVEFVDNPTEAEIVHSHIFPLEETQRYLRSHPAIPYLLSSHGLYWAEYDWPNWAIKANAGCMEAIRQADHITAPSEWVAQSIRRNSLRPTTAIGHGIDIEDWEFVRKENFVLWNKTRTDPICNSEDVAKLALLLPEVRFISTFGPSGAKNIEITGTLPYQEAKRLVQSSAIYLCTARETFGIGTLEAMAAASPVVGWNWGGQRQIVHHKETGWLAEPGNYDELAEGILYCLKHGAEMGAAAREEVIKKYQWKDVVEEYYKLYQKLLAAKSKSGPKVSVIVPAYGFEQYLSEALDSVKQQTFQDWECIIVDDASPDRCGAIADSYAAQDSRYHVIHNKANEYLAGALNTGVGASRGRYVLPLDADNTLPPNTLEILAKALDKDRGLHIAYGNVEFLEPDGKRWHSGWPPQFRAEWQVKYQEKSNRPANLIPSGSMFRREVWQLTGGYRRRWRTAEDADFWTRATSYGFRAAMVTEADVLVYRNRSDSMSREEKLQDWTLWMPWSRELAAAPAAIPYDKQVPVPSYEPILVSIIIPVGPGHEGLVIDAIDSVDAQTFRLWECIVINDSGCRLPNLSNWATVITPAKQLGVAAARNLGVRHAKAKLFVPLDADDTLEPDALARMFEIWQEYKGYVYGDWVERWDSGHSNVWRIIFVQCQNCSWMSFEGEAKQGNCPKCGSAEVSLLKDSYDASYLIKKGCLHAVTALYPVEAWKQVGGFDEKLPAWEDWDFQLKLANIGVCGTRLPQPIFTYRKDTGMRREENYAEFEKSKQGILDKWGSYFRGEKELMGCSKCPGGGGRKVQAQPRQATRSSSIPPPENGSVVIMEYTGRKDGVVNYRGPSGQMYRFAAIDGERQKLVRADDAQHFLKFGDFKIVEKVAPV